MTAERTDRFAQQEQRDAALDELSRARPRPEPDPQARARVLLRVQAAFESQLRARRRRRRRLGFAMTAATLLCVVVLAQLDSRVPDESSPPIAARQFVIDAVRGEVVLAAEGSVPRIAEKGGRVEGGQQLSSGAAASVSMRSPGGLRLRLAGASVLRLQRDGSLSLAQGSVYVDTDAAQTPAEQHVRISVGDARIENQGTRFSVSSSGAALTIAVRSGSVSWTEGAERATVQARERLQIDAGRVIARTEVDDLNAEFGWALAAAAFPPQETALAEVLVWYAAETGRSLQIATGLEIRMAQRIEGSSSAREPRQRVQALLAAAGLTMRETADRIEVGCLSRSDCG